MSATEKEKSADSLSEQIEKLGKLLAIFSILVFLLSICFDFGFFQALGLDFSELPTSISDHVRSALVWAPTAAIILLIIALIEMQFVIIEKGAAEEELIKSSPNPEFTRRFRAGPEKLYWPTVIIYYGFLSVVDPRIYPKFALGAIVWFLVARYMVFHDKIAAKFSRLGGILLLFGPPLMLCVCAYGAYQGSSLIKNKSENWVLTIKINSNKEELRIVKGLRRFESFSIIVAVDGVLFVVPNSNIIDAKRNQIEDNEQPFLCKVYYLEPVCKKDFEKKLHYSDEPLCTARLSQSIFSVESEPEKCNWRFFGLNKH